MLVVMGLTCRSLPGQSISSEASVDGLEACGLSSHIVEDVCSLNLRRKVTNRGHAVVSVVVVCCSFHSAVGESDPCTVASRTLSLVIVDRCCPGMYPCFPRVDNGVRNMVGYDDHLSTK